SPPLFLGNANTKNLRRKRHIPLSTNRICNANRLCSCPKHENARIVFPNNLSEIFRPHPHPRSRFSNSAQASGVMARPHLGQKLSLCPYVASLLLHPHFEHTGKFHSFTG